MCHRRGNGVLSRDRNAPLGRVHFASCSAGLPPGPRRGPGAPPPPRRGPRATYPSRLKTKSGREVYNISSGRGGGGALLMLVTGAGRRVDTGMASGQSPSGSCRRGLRGGLVRRPGYPFAPRTRLPAPTLRQGARRRPRGDEPPGLPPRHPHAPTHGHARGRVRAHARTRAHAPAAMRTRPRAHARRAPDAHTAVPREATGGGGTHCLLAGGQHGSSRPRDLSARVSEGPSVPRWAPGFRPHDGSWRHTTRTEPTLTFWKLPPG